MPTRIILPSSLTETAFTTSDARRDGVDRGRLRAGDLDHPHHGVYSHGLDAYSLRDRCMALLPAIGPEQCFSHLTAARLWGFPLPFRYRHDERLHVLTRGDRPPMRRPGIHGWETDWAAVIQWDDDLPLAAPADVWAQLSVLAAGRKREGLTQEWLVAIGDFLVSGARTESGKADPLCAIADLEKAAHRHRGKRGAKLLSWSLPLVRTGVDSPKETELRLGLVAAGLPEPEIQLTVVTAAGQRHADLGYREARLLLEFQGDEHRVDRQRWMSDLTRVQLFEDAGYRVMLIADADLKPNCGALASRIRRALIGTAFSA